jgi:glutathione S-transferase
LNVELIARRLYAEAFFGRTVSHEIKDEVRAKITSGLTGLARLMKLSPYALGDKFTAADVAAWPHLQLVSIATQKIYCQNLVVKYIPGIEAYIKMIESRPYVQKIGEERTAALAAKLQNK